ncbi:hypothetical protein G6F48_003435 [Rhizopus delemar]|nr:hypothetical protein G6F48_003435 [Rhizopus delemar]KAG1647068.1 hypothetical protein G6F44_000191 [Rhizopus delemar]
MQTINSMDKQPTMEKPKRKQVKNACVNCQKACKKCDDGRPCKRCIKLGLTATCRDSDRKERKKGVKRGPYKKRQGYKEQVVYPKLTEEIMVPSQTHWTPQDFLYQPILSLSPTSSFASSDDTLHYACGYTENNNMLDHFYPSFETTQFEKLLSMPIEQEQQQYELNLLEEPSYWYPVHSSSLPIQPPSFIDYTIPLQFNPCSLCTFHTITFPPPPSRLITWEDQGTRQGRSIVTYSRSEALKGEQSHRSVPHPAVDPKAGLLDPDHRRRPRPADGFRRREGLDLYQTRPRHPHDTARSQPWPRITPSKMHVADRASASCPARHPIRLIAPDRDRPSQTSSNQVKAQGSAVVHRLVHPQGGGQGPLAGLVVRSVVVCQGRDRWAITHPQWIRLARLLELCLVELRSRGQGVRDDRRSIDWIGWPWTRKSFLSLFLSPTWLSGPSLASFFALLEHKMDRGPDGLASTHPSPYFNIEFRY